MIKGAGKKTEVARGFVSSPLKGCHVGAEEANAFCMVPAVELGSSKQCEVRSIVPSLQMKLRQVHTARKGSGAAFQS